MSDETTALIIVEILKYLVIFVISVFTIYMVRFSITNYKALKQMKNPDPTPSPKKYIELILGALKCEREHGHSAKKILEKYLKVAIVTEAKYDSHTHYSESLS